MWELHMQKVKENEIAYKYLLFAIHSAHKNDHKWLLLQLVPLFVCVGGGALFATAYVLRLTQNADAR